MATHEKVKVSTMQIALPILFATILVLSLIFSSVKAIVWSPQKIGIWQIEYAQLVTPQGWSFFTRSAKEPNTVAFGSNGSPLSKLPTSRTTNAFGLNREGRAQGIEIGLITASIGEKSFHDCKDLNLPDCLAEARNTNLEPIKVHNPVTRPSLCGEVFLFSTRPYSYEYRKYVKSPYYGEGWVNLEIECQAK